MTECELKGQALVDLLSCFAQQSGVATAEFVNNKIQEVIGVHGVDVNELAAKIALINAELDADDVAFQGLLDAVTALQTAVANNSSSITTVNNALTSAVAGLEASIASERARVNAELARIEALITPHYDDTEVRALIQANLEAIGSEAATRAAAVTRLEGLIAANSTEIEALKTAVASNVAAIAANNSAIQAAVADIAAVQTAVAALQTAVANNTSNIAANTTAINANAAQIASNKAATDAKIAEVENCFSAFFGVIESTTCESLTDAFKAGLGAGNQSTGL